MQSKQQLIHNNRLQLQLIHQQYHCYQHQPERYLLEIILKNNPWPQKSSQHIATFIKSISQTYQQIPYHHLTHAFDVMIRCDQFLIAYGWRQKLSLNQIDRIFMLMAAYAHDSGHQGLTNAFYINSKHKIAEYINSPLQNMHFNNLKNLLREYDLEIAPQVSFEIAQMILKTDNGLHKWAQQKIQYLKVLQNDKIKEKDNSLIAKCILMHASDLNNPSKEFEINLRWGNAIALQFERQALLQCQQGLPITCIINKSNHEFYKSNILFIDHLVLPLYKGLTQLEKKCQYLYSSILKNKAEFQNRIKNQLEIYYQ